MPPGQYHRVTMSTFIYALVDPRDGRIRYVGKANDPRLRLRRHVVGRNEGNRKAEWILELWSKGLRPKLRILEEVPHAEWQDAEKRWIAKLKPPLNSLDGGNGGGVPKQRYEAPIVTCAAPLIGISQSRWRVQWERVRFLRKLQGRGVLPKTLAEEQARWLWRLVRAERTRRATMEAR